MITETLKTEYQRLPDNFRKNSFDYSLIERVGDVAIFKQYDAREEIDFVAYEVFEIRKQNDAEVFGKKILAKETCPSNGEWGNNAYTVYTIEQAKSKMKQILEVISSRKSDG